MDSEAEVAEIAFTAFTSKAKAKQVTARLIVRRVPDVNPAHQSPLFTVYRYHAVFTNSPLPMLEAEKAHRAHAIVEQVIADLKHAPGRLARSARKLVLHLPVHWPWETAWTQMATTAREGPPLAA